MGTGQSEHHVTFGLGQSEQETGDIGRQRFAKRSEEDDERHDTQHAPAIEQGADVDEHAHTNQDGVANELDAVHQWRHVRYIPI